MRRRFCLPHNPVGSAGWCCSFFTCLFLDWSFLAIFGWIIFHFNAFLCSKFALLLAEDLCRCWRRGWYLSQIATNAPKQRFGLVVVYFPNIWPQSPDTALTREQTVYIKVIAKDKRKRGATCQSKLFLFP